MAGVMRQTELGPEFFDGIVKLRRISEIVTIPVGSGAAGVASTSNLWPAGLILSTGFKVVEAPGGGAATIDIGVTAGADQDRLIDGLSCDVINENGVSPQDGDGNTAYPAYNKTATTLTLTTNANVLVSRMRVLVETVYLEFNAPQA